MCHSVDLIDDGGYIAAGTTVDMSFYGLYLVRTNAYGDTIWTRTYGDTAALVSDEGMAVKQLSDGSFIILGNTSTFGGGGENDGIWLLKLDEDGDTVWITRYQKEGYICDGYDMQTTNDGGFIITGTHYLYEVRMWLIKTDVLGNVVWEKTYGGSYSTIGLSVDEMSDGSYLISGSIGYYPWMVRTDSTGDTLWTKMYDDMPGGKVHCAQETKDGGYIATGTYGTGLRGMFVMRTDSSGSIDWRNVFDLYQARCHWGYHVEQTSDEGYIATGAALTLNPSYAERMLLWKFNSEGEEEWYRIFDGGESATGGHGKCVKQTPDGGYIVGGDIAGKFALVKTEIHGDTVTVSEPDLVANQTNWRIENPIGSQIVLNYSDLPSGFHAIVFDASGCKVDELRSLGSHGNITWGDGQESGVYFIKAVNDKYKTDKVILLK